MTKHVPSDLGPYLSDPSCDNSRMNKPIRSFTFTSHIHDSFLHLNLHLNLRCGLRPDWLRQMNSSNSRSRLRQSFTKLPYILSAISCLLVAFAGVARADDDDLADVVAAVIKPAGMTVISGNMAFTQDGRTIMRCGDTIFAGKEMFIKSDNTYTSGTRMVIRSGDQWNDGTDNVIKSGSNYFGRGGTTFRSGSSLFAPVE